MSKQIIVYLWSIRNHLTLYILETFNIIYPSPALTPYIRYYWLLKVDNIEKSLAMVEANGGKIVIPKTKIETENRGYFSICIDSEGNSIGLYSGL